MQLSWDYNMTLSIIANETGPVHSRPPSHRMPDGSIMDTSRVLDTQLIATHDFETAPPLDVLLVSGGLGRLHLDELNDREAENFIASRINTTEYILSVCTGAGFLARAGVLEGLSATTNKAAFASESQLGENVTWIPSARWVHDGKVWTSSGVTAGMDMITAFLRHIYGDPKVNNAINNVEYVPHVDPTWDPFSIIHQVSCSRDNLHCRGG
jgi:transcriptional regulator GlxA family with amidase domain